MSHPFNGAEMNWNNVVVKVGLVVGIAAWSVAALCASIQKTYTILSDTTINGQKALIFVRGNSILVSIADPDPVITNADTLYASDMLSGLATSYRTHDIAVVASVTRARQFVPAFSDSVRTVFASESVTVNIEMVLKGDIRREWNFIHAYAYPSHSLYVNAETGDSSFSIMNLSHGTPGFESVLKTRMLLFMNNNAVLDTPGALFPMPIGTACNSSTNAYILNAQDEICFDGEMDVSDGKLCALREMRVPFDHLLPSVNGKMATVAPHKQSAPHVSAGSVPGAIYDLCGRKIPESRIGTSSTRANGVRIYTTRIGDGCSVVRKVVTPGR